MCEYYTECITEVCDLGLDMFLSGSLKVKILKSPFFCLVFSEEDAGLGGFKPVHMPTLKTES